MYKKIIFSLFSIVFLYADNNYSKILIEQSKKSCDEGNATDCFTLGIISAPENYEKSKGFVRKGCDIVGMDECVNMALFYYNKNKKSMVLGIKFFDVVCDMGNAKACLFTGLDYEKGNGVKKDAIIAKEFYEHACENNEPLGCLSVSKMYSEGKIIRQNHYKAKEYAGKACDNGSKLGCKVYKEYNKYIPFDPLEF